MDVERRRFIDTYQHLKILYRQEPNFVLEKFLIDFLVS